MGWQPASDSCSLQAPDASRCGRSSGRIGCPRAPLPAPFRGFQTLLANINSVVMKSLAACSCAEEKGRMLHLKRVFSESATSASAETARATWAGTQLGTGGGSDVPSCHRVPMQDLGEAQEASELQNQGSSQNKNPSRTQQQRPRGFWSLRQPPASTWCPPTPLPLSQWQRESKAEAVPGVCTRTGCLKHQLKPGMEKLQNKAITAQ